MFFKLLSGFLNTNTAPHQHPRMANYGLMDQIAALKWVQQNIEQFGGDPSAVTLFGHRTGAACIHFLMESPAAVAGISSAIFKTNNICMYVMSFCVTISSEK
jgi:carboxylesterase type B